MVFCRIPMYKANFQAQQQSYLDVEQDDSGNPVTDPNNSDAYKMTEIENPSGMILPSNGLMIEFVFNYNKQLQR